MIGELRMQIKRPKSERVPPIFADCLPLRTEAFFTLRLRASVQINSEGREDRKGEGMENLEGTEEKQKLEKIQATMAKVKAEEAGQPSAGVEEPCEGMDLEKWRLYEIERKQYREYLKEKGSLPEEEDEKTFFDIDWKTPLPFHEETSLLPFMSEKEYCALVKDIRINGLQVPIVLYEGKILDGRHRYMACIQTCTEPKFVEWDCKGSVSDYLLSMNYHRHHYTASQRAAIAVDFLPALEAEALKRKRAGLSHHESLAEHDPSCPDFQEELYREIVMDESMEGIKFFLPDTYKSEREKFPQGSGRTRDILSKIFGVSGRYISDAKTVQGRNPELWKLIKGGKISLQDAKRVLKLSEEKQSMILQGIQAGSIPNVRKAIADNKTFQNSYTALKAAFRDLKRWRRKYSYYRRHEDFEILSPIFTEVESLSYFRLKRFINSKRSKNRFSC